MLVSRSDQIGAGIVRMGVHELAVSEVIWRLTGPEDLDVDIGANYGYFTGLMAVRAREVIGVEPNPQLIRFLVSNRLRWGATSEKVQLDFRAVSDRNGTAVLHLPCAFGSNHGLATLASTEDVLEDYEVETVTIDQIVSGRQVGVMKIDIEGHELAAFRGASETLAGELIRDIVFEDHERLPSPVSTMLEDAGFSIFGIDQTFLGPRLIPPGWPPRGWDAPNYLATRRPRDAQALIERRGWRVLYPHLRGLCGRA